jgi:phosphonate transport system substrate-binding protein
MLKRWSRNAVSAQGTGSPFTKVALYCLMLLSGVSSPATAAEDPLLLGVFPRRNPSELVEMFMPLARYLAGELGRPVKLETAPDFSAFWDAVAAKRYHIVHYNQYHYVRSHKQLNYRLVGMNEEDGKSLIAGVIVARKDSGIASLKELRGTTIIFGGNRQAMNSYITPTYLLRQAGLESGSYGEEFATNPPNVALGVYYKRAQAGGMGDIVYDTPFVREKIDVTKLTTLAKSPPVPHLAWAVREDIQNDLLQKIQRALLRVKQAPNAQEILRAAFLTNIVAADDKQYDYVREVIANVMGEQY